MPNQEELREARAAELRRRQLERARELRRRQVRLAALGVLFAAMIVVGLLGLLT